MTGNVALAVRITISDTMEMRIDLLENRQVKENDISTREYSIVNCQTREISMWQEQPKGPVISPWGVISDDILAQKAHVSKNYTISNVYYKIVTSGNPTSMIASKGLSV